MADASQQRKPKSPSGLGRLQWVQSSIGWCVSATPLLFLCPSAGSRLMTLFHQASLAPCYKHCLPHQASLSSCYRLCRLASIDKPVTLPRTAHACLVRQASHLATEISYYTAGSLSPCHRQCSPHQAKPRTLPQTALACPIWRASHLAAVKSCLIRQA